MPAVPGYKPPLKALCVVPQGMEEGTELLIDEREFGLVTGRAAEFRFFSSSVRSGDTPGQICRTPNAILRILACSKSRFRRLVICRWAKWCRSA